MHQPITETYGLHNELHMSLKWLYNDIRRTRHEWSGGLEGA